MALIAKKRRSLLPLIEEGMHHAVCQGVVELGTQFNEKFKKSTHQIMIIFELPEQRILRVNEDGKVIEQPRVISKKYNCSLHEKSTLSKDLQSWRGKRFTKEEEEGGFDLKSLLGQNCTLQILHSESDGKTYANISAVFPVFPGMQLVEPENPVIYFSFTDHGDKIPANVPEWIADLIKNSEEWIKLKSTDDVDDTFNPDELEN